MKILAFATDVIPLPGLPTSGTALRTLGLIEGLCANGHEAVVSVPRNALDNLYSVIDLPSLNLQTQKALEHLKSLAFDASNQSEIISDVNPDVILCGHWPAMTLSSKPSQAVIIDLAGPHLLERHYQGIPNHAGAVYGKLNALSRADYYIVSGPSQRLYFLSFLLRAKVENPEQRIVTIPMPLDPKQPARQERDINQYPRFVFGGVFLPWQNPSDALTQLGEEISKRKSGSLTLIGGKHPSYDIKDGVYSSLFSNLSKNPQVIIKPMLPYHSFIKELGGMDVAIDLMKWNLERELAVTIRTTTYLWSGVPVIYNDYADLGDIIAKYDAGWQVSPEDPQALADVIEEIYSSPDLLDRKSKNAVRLSQEVFSWDRAVQPLLALLGGKSAKQLCETDIFVDFPDKAELRAWKGHDIEQYFVCRTKGLNRIECRLSPGSSKAKEKVTFELYETARAITDQTTELPEKKDLRLITRKELNLSSLSLTDWCSLEMDPLANSAGKTYVFRITSEEKKPERAAGPWTLKGSPYPLLGLYHAQQQIAHTALCLRTSCCRSV